MLKDALQWSVYLQQTESIPVYRRKRQPLQISPCMPVLILPTPEGWKAEWTLAGKKVIQIFNPRPGRESNWGPQDWEAEILITVTTPPSGRGEGVVLILLLFYEKPHPIFFSYWSLTHIPCPILANPTSQQQSNPESHTVCFVKFRIQRIPFQTMFSTWHMHRSLTLINAMPVSFTCTCRQSRPFKDQSAYMCDNYLCVFSFGMVFLLFLWIAIEDLSQHTWKGKPTEFLCGTPCLKWMNPASLFHWLDTVSPNCEDLQAVYNVTDQCDCIYFINLTWRCSDMLSENVCFKHL